MIIKKSHPRFRVPNYGAKGRSRVKESWRKQRGTDNKKRRKLKGYGALPRIGYKNSKEVIGLRRDGMKEMVVHNEKELLAAINSKYVIKFAHDLSVRKRIAMQSIADAQNAKIANRVAK